MLTRGIVINRRIVHQDAVSGIELANDPESVRAGEREKKLRGFKTGSKTFYIQKNNGIPVTKTELVMKPGEMPGGKN